MIISLYNLEPKIVNVAMMRVSRYHKDRGDTVIIHNPTNKKQKLLVRKKTDRIYAFSIFDFTDKSCVTSDMICGGSGFDLTTKLPPDIEKCDYDWSLYPECDYSLVWFSHGCIRNCPFCIVRRKEGNVEPCEPKNLNPNGRYIKVYDNNFFASPMWREAITQLISWNQPCDFAGGIDVRLMNKEKCETLNKLKYEKHPKIKMAWDNPKENLLPKFEEVIKYIKPYKIMVYVLIGYWSDKEQDIMRVEKLRDIGMIPFVMPYNKKDYYQHHFARYVNHKAIFKSHTWKKYQERYMGINNTKTRELC